AQRGLRHAPGQVDLAARRGRRGGEGGPLFRPVRPLLDGRLRVPPRSGRPHRSPLILPGALHAHPGVCYGRPPVADNLTLTRDGAIATVTLARPDRRNSLSDAMLRDLGAVLTELRDDGATRVVIVTGAPPVFSAGADAPIRREMSDAERRQAF